VVVGKVKLRGEDVSSPDIRAGMALLQAALCAKGESTIFNVGQIDRGYQAIEKRLEALGAKIRRVSD
jgi:UDP-N-acetylglucosamine 1-carboxyvinyltransferase